MEKYKSNTTYYDKVMGMYAKLPSVKSLSINNLRSGINTAVIQIGNEIYTINDPPELKPEGALGFKPIDLD